MVKKYKDQPMKYVVHLKPNFKWDLNKRAREASTLSKDLRVTGFENLVVGR